MKQSTFESFHRPTWQRVHNQVCWLETRPRAKPPEDIAEFPRLYGLLCQHYTLAKQRHYREGLIHELHELVARAHNQLYRPRGVWRQRLANFLMREFPAALRRERVLFAVALSLFLVPGGLFFLLAYIGTDAIYLIMSEGSVRELEEMYSPERTTLGWRRDADSEMVMFTYYIYNNVGIGFRSFAFGLLLGYGAALVLVFNGIHIGAVAGHLAAGQQAPQFWSFVAGHSAFELTAILICGTAGLQLARAFFAPGRRTRWDALRFEANQTVPLLIGATVMLLMAAFIEAFWSGRTEIPVAIKYGIGALFWSGVVAYFTLMGRGRHGS